MTEAITDQDILNRLVKSEAGKQAAAAIERDRTAERMNLKAQGERLKRERSERGRELADAEAAARQRVEAARKELTEAEHAYMLADSTRRQTAAHYNARIDKFERELVATAPAGIDEFLAWLADQENACTATEIQERGQPTKKLSKLFTGGFIHEVWTNAASLKERLEAIRAARQAAETLKARVLDDADIEARLDELRDGLPEIEMRYSHDK